MTICLDIGSDYSGVVKIDNGQIVYSEKIKNIDVLKIECSVFDIILIEFFDSVHGKIGKTTIDAIFWTGRIFEHFRKKATFVSLIGRKECLKTLNCKNDKEVISFIRSTKPYGKKLKADCWQAYALYLCNNL